MKRTFFLFFCLLLTISLYAEKVQVEQAQIVAADFFRANHPQQVSTTGLRMVWDGETASTRAQGVDPSFYVFNSLDGKGFVIVAGDDVAMPVLGYSFKNGFEQTNMPDNLKYWMNFLRKQIDNARRTGKSRSAIVEKSWAAARSAEVEVQLNTAQWDQTAPYYDLCPMVEGSPSYTGCTATALAIIMRHHCWPESGTGTLPSYKTQTYGVNVSPCPLGHAYDWANMPLQYEDNSYSTTEATAVATLMRDCALMLKADFCPINSSGTSASIGDVVPGMSTYMDYDKSAVCIPRYYYSDTEWYRMLKGEIKASRPVLYAGDKNGTMGHAFVLDGYTADNYFSVNWGWSGYCNGYYLLSALEPADTGAGGGSSVYNDNQWAVIGLKKNEGGAEAQTLRFTEYVDERTHKVYHGFSVSETYFKKDYPFDLSYGFVLNQSEQNFNGIVRIALANQAGEMKPGGTLMSGGKPLEYRDGLYPWYGIFDDFTDVTIPVEIELGDRIRAFYQTDATDEWLPVLGNEDAGCVWEVVVGVEEPSIEESTTLNFSKKDKQVRLSVKPGVAVQLFAPDGSDLSSHVEGSGRQFSFDTMQLPAGTYLLKLKKENEQKELKISIGSNQ